MFFNNLHRLSYLVTLFAGLSILYRASMNIPNFFASRLFFSSVL